jgi:hypothetical protein
MLKNEPVSERNYIDIQDLGKVRDLASIHKSICQENSESISEDEYKQVGEIIWSWMEKLSDKIHCKTE